MSKIYTRYHNNCPDGFGIAALDPDFDCSEIAKLYGGGGHKNSAGFKIAI